MKQRKQPLLPHQDDISAKSDGMYPIKRGRPTRETILNASVSLNVVLALTCIVLSVTTTTTRTAKPVTSSSQDNLFVLRDGKSVGKKLIWHGGHPQDERAGQCWCGADTYCMCTPSLAIDLIIASGPDHIWLVRRKDTNQLATMGGFVDVGESVESAVKRELMEEMGIDLEAHQIQLFGVYSDPRRDNRRHTVSAVFLVRLDADLHPHAADDVKAVERIPLTGIENHDYFADHMTILRDYKRSLGLIKNHEDGDFATDVLRSTCSKSEI
jgi:ADP-ribose pyrophosphatase YjhB (NUDIX family)